MKRYCVIFLFAIFAFSSFAQSHKYYCEVKGYEKGLTSKVKIVFDFGESFADEAWKCSSRKLRFVNEKGKKMKFKSFVDAANFMAENGWNLQEAYSAPSSGGKSIKHWIFYKEANGVEEVKKGFVTPKEYKKAKKVSKK